MTWNPVWGCLNHCEYCYARKITKRFGSLMAENEYRKTSYISDAGITTPDDECVGFTDNLKNFKPTFLYSQFGKKFPKKPQKIFVGSMSEIYYWKKEWIEKIIEKVKQYPQHTFQFLTKFPKVYSKYIFPKNCWLGTIITKNDDFDKGAYNFIFPKNSETNRHNIKYISFEPLLGKILDLEILKYFDWVIIGAETGNRKGKVIPKLEWIDDIIYYCRKNNIPIYLKDSLKPICPSLWKVIPIMKNQPSLLSYKPIKEFPIRR